MMMKEITGIPILRLTFSLSLLNLSTGISEGRREGGREGGRKEGRE